MGCNYFQPPSTYLRVDAGWRCPEIYFSGSMRSLHKIYSKLRAHVTINSSLPVTWDWNAEQMEMRKGMVHCIGSLSAHRKADTGTLSMSCVAGVKCSSAFSVYQLHVVMKLQACLMEASHTACFYPHLYTCLHTQTHICLSAYFIFRLRH